MRIPLILLLVTVVLSIFIDGYIYCAIRRRVQSSVPARIQLISALCFYAVLILGMCLPMRSGDAGIFLVKMWILFGYITVIVSKATFVLFDLVARIPSIFGRHRIKALSFIGGVAALTIFLAMWWGALVNRKNIETVRIDIPIEHLPAAFDDYRIVQISDLHVGTFGDDTSYVDRLVDYVNSLHPDVIFFTGDVVNRTSEELKPFVSSLSRLDAPDGVYSILGNHDYGDYFDWQSDSDKIASHEKMISMQKQMGWRLLLNEHEFIHRGPDSIAVIGVENVGDPPFKVYGDLAAAYPDLSDGITKILLTHNPAHWKMDIADRDNANVSLTLSGHTHAMQMRVLGLSPASLRYDTWGGLYRDDFGLHPLYVNIGVGTVGMPMRLGATPEVTLITLKSAERK